jgi:hypothetical protein
VLKSVSERMQKEEKIEKQNEEEEKKSGGKSENFLENAKDAKMRRLNEI